jgi:hypothetical protein
MHRRGLNKNLFSVWNSGSHLLGLAKQLSANLSN